MNQLKEALTTHLDCPVIDDPVKLDEFSRDASLFEVQPKIIVQPKTVGDLENLVTFVNHNLSRNLSLTARSGGTDMTGGPLTESIVVDMKAYFKEVIEVGEDFARTQPGVYYRDFEKATMRQHLLMPSYPASREICTIGGMVANNSGGEKTLSYGKTEDYVTETKIVLADGHEYTIKPLNKTQLMKKIQQPDFEGRLYKKLFKLIDQNYDLIKAAKPAVTKNSAGYYLWNVWDRERGIFDLNKLIVGSQGTLGLITEIKFRLIRPKKHSQLLVIFLKDLKHLTEIVQRVLTFKPESFESYDDHTLKLAIRFFPEIAARMHNKNIFSFFWQFLPEAKMILTSGLPKLVLLAEFTGDELADIHQRSAAAEESLFDLNLQTYRTFHRRDEEKYWLVRRESFNLLRHHVCGKHTAPFIDDVVVTPEQLPQFLPELDAIMAKYKLIYTIAGHVGDANFHIIPLMDLKDPKTKKIIPELSAKVYELVFCYKGSITGEHNDGLIRTPYLKAMYGAKVYNLFKGVKSIFDPNNIFNPGKKVGSNLEYALDHFIEDEKAS